MTKYRPHDIINSLYRYDAQLVMLWQALLAYITMILTQKKIYLYNFLCALTSSPKDRGYAPIDCL